jgi:hypothetical protein
MDAWRDGLAVPGADGELEAPGSPRGGGRGGLFDHGVEGSALAHGGAVEVSFPEENFGAKRLAD